MRYCSKLRYQGDFSMTARSNTSFRTAQCILALSVLSILVPAVAHATSDALLFSNTDEYSFTPGSRGNARFRTSGSDWNAMTQADSSEHVSYSRRRLSGSLVSGGANTGRSAAGSWLTTTYAIGSMTGTMLNGSFVQGAITEWIFDRCQQADAKVCDYSLVGQIRQTSADPNTSKTYSASRTTTQLFLAKACTLGASDCGTTFPPTNNAATAVPDNGSATQLGPLAAQPTSLLMMGMGLLGAGFVGRFKAKLKRQ